MNPGEPPYKLNVGCGRNIQEGWINLDSAALPGVDLVCDLESVRETPIALPDESVGQFLISHVIEHVRDSLGLMQELWRLATPGAIARHPRSPWRQRRCLGRSDPRSRLLPGQLRYLSQPFYSNADYGYRADWNPEKLTLLVYRGRCAGLSPQQIIAKSQIERNLVKEMICELRAVKPMREPRRELQTRGQIEILPVD